MSNDKWIDVKDNIYVASRTRHAPMWLELRSQGYNIISTWIDEYKAGESLDLRDLILRCITESIECDCLILYVEPTDILKCALVEVGAALAYGKHVFIIGECQSTASDTLYSHPNVWRTHNIKDILPLLPTKQQPQ